jgi:HEPN domain-containing protein
MTNGSSSPDYPKEYYAQLLFYARSDLAWAKSQLERTNHFYHKPCFEARECVEKSLKAFLYDFTQEMADEAIAIATEIYELVERKIA